jgi:hypothetical protein
MDNIYFKYRMSETRSKTKPINTTQPFFENSKGKEYIKNFITPLCNIYQVTKEYVVSDNFVIILFMLLNRSMEIDNVGNSKSTEINNVDDRTSMDTSNEQVIESVWTVDNNLLVKSRGDSFHDFFDKVRSVLVLYIDKIQSKNMLDIFLLSNFVTNLLKNREQNNYDLCYKMLQIYINCKIQFTTDGNAIAHTIMNTRLYDYNSSDTSNVGNQFLLEGNLIDYLGSYKNDYYIIACTLYYYSTEKFVKLTDEDIILLKSSTSESDFINKLKISDNSNINMYVNLFYGALSRVYSDNIDILNNQLIFFFKEYQQYPPSSENFKQFLSAIIEPIGQENRSINNSFPNIHGRFYRNNKSNYNIKNFNDNLNNFKNINKDGCDLLIGEGVCVVDADANKKTSNFNYGITSSSNNNRVILSNTLSNRLDESSEGLSKLQKALQQVNLNTSYSNSFNNTNPCIVHFKLADNTHIRSYHIGINREEKQNNDSILSKIDEILGSVDYMLLRTGQNIDDEEDGLDQDYLSDNGDDDDDDDESYVEETSIKENNMTVEEGITIDETQIHLVDEYKTLLNNLLNTENKIERLKQKQSDKRDVEQIQKRKKSIEGNSTSMTNVDENVTMTTFEEENNDVNMTTSEEENNDVNMTTSEEENNEIKLLEEQLKMDTEKLNELQHNETITKLGLKIVEY